MYKQLSTHTYFNIIISNQSGFNISPLLLWKCLERGTHTVISNFPAREPVLQAPETGVREVTKNAVRCMCVKITAQKVIIEIMQISVMSSIYYMSA